MGAKVESAGNDTKGIAKAMDDLGKQLGDLDRELATMKKLQAQISKSPDECRKPVEQLLGELAWFQKATKDFDAVAKVLKTGVAK